MTLATRLAALPALPAEPLVSVLLAVRDESRHIEAALAAVCAQRWPAARLEVLVIDGESRDDTRARVLAIAARDPRVRLLDNPRRHVADGLGVGLGVARGAVIVRVDGHCVIPPGYVRACVTALRERPELACAGGPVRAQGRGAIARAIALAMSTPFGVGGAAFRWARAAREVDHLPFGAWRREVFEWLGGFDTRLVRNQDDEFSDRLRRAGGSLWLLPDQVVAYESRATLAGLWRQYFGYGFWKVRVIALRGGQPSSLRHVVPTTFLLALGAGALAAALAHAWWPAAIVPALYAVTLALATALTWARTRRAEALLLPSALAVMHVAYGAGFLAALLVPLPDAHGASAPPAVVPGLEPAIEPAIEPAAEPARKAA